jgi:flagellar biosynthesis/type III secretory pathway protein FliH
MNWLLALPAEEEVVFREELGRLQRETRMPYISTYDRLVRAEGLEEGLLLGRQEGWKEGWKEGWREGWREGWKEGWREGRQECRLAALREMIVEALLKRFETSSEAVRLRLEVVEDETALRQLVKRVWTVGSMAEFEAEI